MILRAIAFNQSGNRLMSSTDPEDQRYRNAAFQHLQQLLAGGTAIA
jgi:hypothetical protein